MTGEKIVDGLAFFASQIDDFMIHFAA